ncbi:MAG TPA: GSU2403 family nucleotidyltransferase fold protein [Polyangiaceae bacterium]
MALFTRHSLGAQTAYSELKRRASEQESVLLGTPGSVDERTVNGSRFFYRQFYDAEGKKSAEYLGPATGQGAARAEDVRAQIVLANELLREARDLARAGYVRTEPRTSAIVASLANHSLFRAGAMLVGSHAYGALLNELGVRAAAYLTEDLDIARGNPLGLALAEGQTFATMLEASRVPLLAVPSFDRKAPSTSFKVKGAGRLRVDLLAAGRGKEPSTRAVPELRAHATALPHLGYLLDASLEGVVLGKENVVAVRLPTPERLAWHKMLVSELRGATREKRSKDLQQAATLVAVLAEDAPESLADAFRALPRGTGALVRRATKQVRATLESAGHTRAVEALETSGQKG